MREALHCYRQGKQRRQEAECGEHMWQEPTLVTVLVGRQREFSRLQVLIAHDPSSWQWCSMLTIFGRHLRPCARSSPGPCSRDESTVPPP
jgi:hypothetical protein